MALVNMKHTEMLAALQEKLDIYMLNNWLVFVHITTPCMEMHHAICPEVATINCNEFVLSFGHFEWYLDLNEVINFDIRTETDGFCIIADEIEVNLDFTRE